MVATETGKLGIVKRAKKPREVVVVRYKDARQAIVEYLCSPTRDVGILVAAENNLQNRLQTAQSQFVSDDATQSIAALHAAQAMQQKLGGYAFQTPSSPNRSLTLAGVRISLRHDMIVTQGNDLGAAILRVSKDDSGTSPAKQKRREMGLYVATLIWMQLQNARTLTGAISRGLCMSIDVQHGEVFVAPRANTKRVRELESACAIIAALWPTL